MDNLDILVKSLNKIENYAVKYIYKKYIETLPDTQLSETNSAETTAVPSASVTSSTVTLAAITPPEETEESIEQLEINYKYSKKPINNEDYKLYTDKIFNKERKYIIKQNDILIADLENISLADDEYESNPTLFHRQQNNSYPDIKRCSYIRKHKNKLIRCKNSIINDDEDMCSRHEDKPNIYWDSYNELVDKISHE